MPSRNNYHPTWVSLTLDVGYLFTAAPAKRSCCSLPWTRGIFSRPPLLTLNGGVAPLGPPVPRHQPLLGGGIAPLRGSPDLRGGVVPHGRRPLPRTWGSSSRPPLLHCSSLVLSVPTLDLGQGVAPHGHTSAQSITAGAQKYNFY